MTAKYNFDFPKTNWMVRYSIPAQSGTTLIDLEERIMECWQVVDDLDYIATLTEANKQLGGLIGGLKALYQMKFEKLWETFENSIK